METRNNVRKLALLAGAALLSTGAIAAPLGDAPMTRSETIKYSVASTATPEGAAALYRKLHETAARVCGGADTASSWLYPAGSYETCFTAALDKAVRRVGIPMVTAMHVLGADAASLAARKAPTDKAGTIASR
jgi:UrcA family protein